MNTSLTAGVVAKFRASISYSGYIDSPVDYSYIQCISYVYLMG